MEILNSGTTDAIPKEVASSRTALSARGLALQSGNSKVSIGSLSLVDKQELIGVIRYKNYGSENLPGSQFNPPPSNLPAPAGATASTAPSATGSPPTTTSATNAIIDSRSQKFGGLVVGRRRRRLEIVIANGSIADVPASTYVLGIFQGVAPSGAAYSVDQRSKGLVQEFYSRNVITGDLGGFRSFLQTALH